MKKLYAFLFLALMMAGLWASLAFSAPSRVWLSEQLIELAWLRSEAGEQEAHPWPWLKSYPVAKLSLPERNKSHVILYGMNGDVMGFAPGWHDGTDPPGQPGISLVSAHKDTHFSYLKDLYIGEPISLETPDGRTLSYRVEATKIVQGSQVQINGYGHGNILLLSTSYPYRNWQEGGALRFVVVARQEKLVLAAL